MEASLKLLVNKFNGRTVVIGMSIEARVQKV